MGGNSYPLLIRLQSCYLQNICQKITLLSHVVALVLVQVCAVLPGFHWPLWRLAWNNEKLLTQASLLNGARRLDHRDVIASLSPRAEQSWHSKPNVIRSNPFGPTQAVITYRLKAWISNPAGLLIIWYHPCDCSYINMEGVTMFDRF